MKSILLSSVVLILFSCLSPRIAMADCANPSLPEASLFYNEDYNVLQYCNGTNWIAMGDINPSAGSGTCANPIAPEASMIYNADYSVMQFCNGQDWIAIGPYPGGLSGSPPAAVYDFEDSSLAAFTLAGDANWTVTTSSKHEGTYAAQSGAIGNDQTTSLILHVYLDTPKTVKFWVSASTEDAWDYGTFILDNVIMGTYTGTYAWSEHTFSLDAGDHYLAWTYSKDDAGVFGSDKIWLDYITFQ